MSPVEVLKRFKSLGLSFGVYKAAWQIVIATYKVEEVKLPENHAWRIGKLEHVKATTDKVVSWCHAMAFSRPVTNVIGLSSLAHDLGRYQQVVRQARGEKIEPTDHGRFSVELLSRVLTPLLGKDAWPLFAEAVTKHSLRQTPPQSDFSSLEAWAVCCVVRDFDKAQGFDNARDYTEDRENMIREAMANKLMITGDNPTAETGSIDTLPDQPDVLKVFLSGSTITRAHCASYEAFMLQYLAWLYDFNIPEVRDAVIKDGGPGIVLSYLRGRLGSENPAYKGIARQAAEAWGLKV